MCADSLWQTPCFVSFDVCWLPILPKVSTIEQSLKMSKRKAIALCHNTTIQIPVLGMMACLSKFVSWPSCPSRLCDWIFRDSKAPRSGKSKEHLRNLHLNAQEAWNLGSWKTAWWYTGGRWNGWTLVMLIFWRFTQWFANHVPIHEWMAFARLK